MSPFAVVVIFILVALFFVLSIIPLLPGQTDINSSTPSPRAKTKGAH